uniref:glycerophosphodiester phosphodiesterase n=3 Tax=Setaria TaxID=4554 RepID=K3XG83_SETIT
MALSRSSRMVAGHLSRYSSAFGSALRYSGEAQGPVISHGFLRNLRRPWNSDLPAPAAEEAAEAIEVGAVVGSTELGGESGNGGDRPMRREHAGNRDGLGCCWAENHGAWSRAVSSSAPLKLRSSLPCSLAYSGESPGGTGGKWSKKSVGKRGEGALLQTCTMRPSRCCVPLFLLLLSHLAFARPLFPLPSKTKNEEKRPIQTFRPYNIAHRGSNGEIPEETAVAYLRAIEEGADFIETDILASKDGTLICFHDVTLDETTDVAEHKEFANRRRTYEVEWSNVTGWFVVDFTLEELKTLKVKQRYSFRDQQYNGMFSIITFEEFISIALDADRTVGIYPEIKDPVFINKHVKWADGKKFEDKFVDTLLKYGYKGQYMSENWLKQPLFIQSFAPTSIIYVSKLIDSPKVFLIDDITVRTQDTNQSYWEITSDDYLAYIGKYVVGLGPWKDTIVPAAGNYLMPPSDLVARAHAHNLQVHPYTYRNENQFLHFNFHQDPYAEYDFWIKNVGVDGLFTDFTGTLHQYQELTSPHRKDETANSLLVKISQMISAYEGL